MNKIREYREKAGLSQVQLGMLSRIPNSMISDFELGKRYVWPRAREALAKALGKTEDQVFPNDPKM